MSIRKAKPEDRRALSILLYESFKEFEMLYTEKAFSATAIDQENILGRMSEGPVWVAVINGKTVGTISLVIRRRQAYIRGMAVHPTTRGQKIGFHLLEEAEGFAKARHLTKLILSTTPFLKSAIRLYEKFGFIRTDDGPDHLFGTPLFTMSKSLQSP